MSERKGMRLQEYHRKRDFKKTTEPRGKKTARTGRSFVIQKHAARALHYDFRLELGGTLKSWAVPKGPSLDPAIKRLAVQVEDHPLEYGSFEGVIPKGEYGAGTVSIWDKGVWTPVGETARSPLKALKNGKLEFRLEGERLRGEWILARMGRKGEAKPQWLLIKRKDAAVRRGARAGASAPRKPIPGFLAPQLATLVEKPPASAHWIHEIKFDGYRSLARVSDGEIRIFTRSGLDWTHRYPVIVEELRGLMGIKGFEDAWLDGEIVCLDSEGRSSFQALQDALSKGASERLYYYVFDLLFLNGEDQRARPLLDRKEILRALIHDAGAERIRFSDHVLGKGQAFFARACRTKLEGIVSKEATQPYLPGRSGQWQKSKCSLRQEFVIGGYTDPEGGRLGIGALHLGAYRPDGRLRYVGKVGTGFDTLTLLDFKTRLEALEQEHSPFGLGAPVRKRGNHWVEPSLVAEIEFKTWTSDGLLRQASFVGLREDKGPREVSAETSEASTAVLTHPAKILFPEDGITKEELAAYYRGVANWIFPYLEDRPITLNRCPDGIRGQCFMQRHPQVGAQGRKAASGVRSLEGEAGEDLLGLATPDGLVSLVQWGTVEIHAWGSRFRAIESPDTIVFDFDPSEKVAWPAVVEAARTLRGLLRKLGLESFVKVSGGKGLHVHVPIAPIYEWDAVKAFAKTIALKMVQDEPQRYTASPLKKNRAGRIFIDYLRNDRASTAVAPYSVRARNGAPVALPVAWSELRPKLKPGSFGMKETLELLSKRKRDPWEGYFKLRQRVSLLDGEERLAS